MAFGDSVFFVMIPLPVTGAYMGTIAAYILKVHPKKALAAISLGVLISCGLITAGSYWARWELIGSDINNLPSGHYWQMLHFG
ncbi:MAG: small multi-drug export protein [Owenweeksia sp.]|nr:small multi-drug export protein [Owenweeksia sp.]